MTSKSHPDQEQLAAYARAKLPESAAEAVADHLERCPACEATVTSLEKEGDTVLSALRQAPIPEAFSDEPECRRAVEQIRVMEPQQATVAHVPPEGPEPEMSGRTPAPSLLREYRLLEKLGQGGMGTVYKALHTKLDKLVALKVLPAAAMSDAELVARFEREMKAVGKLEHPNIVRAMDAGCHEGTHFLVMEYVDGLDLSEIVKRCGGLRIADACEVIRQAALGLRHADEHALVHRDIKPSNLVLNADGEVKILDLGLALLQADPKPGEEATGRGRAMGTIDYIAPEQVRDSHRVDIRADLYSLGCTFYKLLTGRSPFSGPGYENTFDKMMAHLNDPVPPIRQFRPDVPDGLAAVLDRMVAKDRDARYAKPGQVADDLKPFCPGCDLAGLLMQARKEAKADTLGQEKLPSPSGRGAGGEGVGQEKPLGAGLPTPPKPATARSPESAAHPPEPRGPGRLVGREEGGVRRPAPSAQSPAPQPSHPTPNAQLPTPFDPYHKWLGIPPAEQPPNHYRLLGIPLFEEDRDVIQAAAERQTVFLRNVALGKHSKESQRLLNEVHQAKLCLLTSDEKATYDARLRQDLAAKAAAALVAGPALGAGLPTPPNATTARSPGHSEDAAGAGRPAGPGQGEGKVRRPAPSASVRAATRVWGSLRRSPRYALVASACAAAVVLLGVIYVTTNKGTVKIELSDPNAKVEVTVDGNQIDITGLQNPLRLSVGEHALEVTSGDFQTVTDRFVIRRGQEETLTVTLVPKGKTVVARADGQTLPASAAPAPPLAVAPFDDKKAKEHQEAWAKHLGVPVETTNSIGMKLVFIPPGEFQMGSTAEEVEQLRERWKNDKGRFPLAACQGPQHRVKITRPFYLGVYEVTQDEYARMMGENPSHFSTTGKGKEAVSGQDTSRFPVDSVTWEKAREFCRLLSEKSEEKAAGRLYGLPTEAEWEYACRAGAADPMDFGPTPPGVRRTTTPEDFAWTFPSSGLKSHAVGQKVPNAWGLYDMHGNIWEWCNDWWGGDYYAVSPHEDPTGPAFGGNRVVRGGYHGLGADLCSSAWRQQWTGAHAHEWHGFRVVCKCQGLTAVRADGNAKNVPAGDTDRKAAEWVLGVGGTVSISSGEGGERQIRDANALPTGRFALLTVLLVGNPKVTDDGLKNLAALASLKHLAVRDTKITDAGCAHLKGLTSLTYLELAGTGVSGSGLTHLKNLTRMERLTLGRNAINDADLQALQGMKDLKLIWLDATGVSDEGVIRLLNDHNDLERIGLGNTQVTDRTLARIAVLPSFVEIDLEGTRITDEGLRHLDNLPNLNMLRINNNTLITDAGCAHLKDLTTLILLKLNNTSITDGGIKSLASLANLKTLFLDGTKISDAGAIRLLENHKQLVHISLADTPVSDAFLDRLRGLTSLTQVDLRGTRVTAAGVARLKASLPRCEVFVSPEIHEALDGMPGTASASSDSGDAEGTSPPSAFAAFDVNKSRQQQEACSKDSGLPVMETNSLGMKMVLIPPGSCWETRGLYPQKITVPEPFYLGVHEVTQEEFQRVMGRNPSSFSPTGSNKDLIPSQDTSKNPVDTVSRLEAVEFCNRLSLAERREPYYRVEGTAITPTGAYSYCLPSRVAWRYAACGDEGSPPALASQDWRDFSWFVANAGGATHPVGQKKPTAFGLYDMYGNVAEFGEGGALAEANLYKHTTSLNNLQLGGGYTGPARNRGFRIARIVEKKDPSGAGATLGVDVNRADREAAEWVLRIGGKVAIGLDGEDWPVSKPEQLPAKRLRVVCVDLRKCQVSDEDLKHLAGLRSIRRLICTSDRVTEAGLGTIAGLPSLEDLHVSGVPVTDQGLAHLAKLKNLHALTCSSRSITELGFQPLAALDSLEVLNLAGSSVDDASLRHVGTLKRLRVLRLDRTKVGDPGLTHLAGLKDLVELNLGATRITDAGLEPVSRLSNLRRLSLPRNRSISDRSVEHLKLLPNLEFLDLHADLNITNAVIAQLSSLPRLRMLNLNATRISDRGLDEIKRLPRLTTLDVGNTNVTDAGMAHLASLTSLGTLVLHKNRLSDAAITHLKKLTGLHYLQLEGTKVTAAGILELRATLRRCRINASPDVLAEVRRLKPSSPLAEELDEEWEQEPDSIEDAEKTVE